MLDRLSVNAFAADLLAAGADPTTARTRNSAVGTGTMTHSTERRIAPQPDGRARMARGQ